LVKLFEVDCHLEYARLSLVEDAREHLAIVKKMIDEMGYHLRDQEVKELEAQLRVVIDGYLRHGV